MGNFQEGQVTSTHSHAVSDVDDVALAEAGGAGGGHTEGQVLPLSPLPTPH